MSEKEGFRYSPDFEVRYRFLSPEEGGRRSGLPRQGYHGDWLYEGDDTKTNPIYMIWAEFEDAEEKILPPLAPVLPQGKARMYIVSNELRQKIHQQRIRVGTKGFLMEGSRKVAEAEVVKIIGLNEIRAKS